MRDFTIYNDIKMKLLLFFLFICVCNLNAIEAQADSTSSRFKELKPEQQNHKPSFVECSQYAPSVEEQQPMDTNVIKVHASDSDPPNQVNGIITYSILNNIGGRAFFKIDNKTGQVVTNFPFDRDEPIRQKELYVTVQATDHGTPPLADICTFKVTILDINDNAPIFDQGDYKVSIAEDLAENSEVVRVFAYDYDDGENSRLTYLLDKNNDRFNEFFTIDNSSGVIYLKKFIGTKGNTYRSTIVVHDNGNPEKEAIAEVTVNVVESNKKSPTLKPEKTEITIKEDFDNFEAALVRIEGVSNTEDPTVAFNLIRGKTAQTNKNNDFVLSHENNSAVIKIARRLDYESVTEYQLQIRAQNKDSLSTTVNIVIKLEDVNDEIPSFIESLKGSVVENGQSGVHAMTVRAIDKDGTSPNRDVFYKLEDHTDIFEIDKNNGVITTKVPFDREATSSYFVQVGAYDGAPSSLFKDKNQPNSITEKFEIVIEDQNDNKPRFTSSFYTANNIKETADIGQIVVEVKAEDEDTAALIVYSIIEGDDNHDFSIETSTGRIKVAKKLDFEKIESYTLTVRAFDGVYEDTTSVKVHILNENDEPPIFDPYKKVINFQEEEVSSNCIINLTAHDPDIKDREAVQNIIYDVVDQKNPFLAVSNNGCVTVIRKLDRDPPSGYPSYQGFIRARDNNGIPKSLDTHAEINITLTDINDNAPILNISEVVWYENQEPGIIVELHAIDYDTDENGPPFQYEMYDNSLNQEFSISGNILHALVRFDREEQKSYDLKIKITDSGKPPLSGVSTLRVIIGDVNDNAAQDGSSEIFVYKYEELDTKIDIGRVYVVDPDDWDLPDKVFIENEVPQGFELGDAGMIIMSPDTEPGEYSLTYRVTEEHLPNIERHTVNANVTVTVKEIPRDAVVKSGSIRLHGLTKEEFVEHDPRTMLSKRDILQQKIANLFNISAENVDVFTVLNPMNNNSVVDVRFSAHSSPYYAPERLNNRVTQHQDELEKDMNAEFVMINVNECFNGGNCTEGECYNNLDIQRIPAVVFTNKTSFVGVGAYSQAVCKCRAPPTEHFCLNGGIPIENTQCSCPEGYEGPHCESLSISFTGNGWALYPTFDTCNSAEISVHVMAQTENGLIFFVGPTTPRQADLSTNFISLELESGKLVLKMDLGDGATKILYDKRQIVDGAQHKIRIKLTGSDLEVTVDDNSSSDSLLWKTIQRKGTLYLNGPLQLGGRLNVFPEEEAKRIWDNPPTLNGFVGCISNFSYNSVLYNLGSPSDSHPSAQPNCNFGVAQAVTFGIDSNFLVAILVCIAILLILLLAVVVQKRKQDNQNEKDMDDTRENIINYEDEGGGECDTHFDLSVLRPKFDEKPVMESTVPADISTFLDNKKHACDKDNLPYDDVRHYGYEGDGNTSGSLSSLASGTDDTDCDMNYLSSFGPRFRKLADMYGDDASEEESPNCDGESWC